MYAAYDELTAKDKLIENIRSDTWFVRAEALGALCAIDKEAALIYAAQSLSHQKAYVRFKALEALVFLRAKGVEDIAEELQYDPHIHVAMYAKSVLESSRF
ncbi:MAG: hypothetical protein Q4E22_04710 [Coriobacteriia bacterium]|nr:hypothetical protein [Coriobacteriia bacterium]